jgi:hypothetical protein
MTNLMPALRSMSVPSCLDLTWYHSGLESRETTNQYDTNRRCVGFLRGTNDSYDICRLRIRF